MIGQHDEQREFATKIEQDIAALLAELEGRVICPLPVDPEARLGYNVFDTESGPAPVMQIM